MLKQAFVQAARQAQPGSGPRDISRVATATGLTRREVTRLSLEQPPALADRPSPATLLFTRWQADRKLHDRRGKPRKLPRQGPAPSFEALALSVTRDVGENNGVDLQISGHTHHGQLFPLNFITGRVYELSRGYKKKGKTHVFVSSGVGTWGPPVRLGNRPEIVNINLRLVDHPG